MKRLLCSAIVGMMLSLGVHAQSAPDAAALTALLQEFLAGASRNDAAMHDRFWADDVIYTGSGGRRRGKAEIMRDVRSAPAPKPGDPTTIYTAEDIRIQQYDKTAIVAFRLVGTTQRENGKSEVAKFLNSGTLIKRKGKWQVVNWQATRIPLTEADAKQEVATAEAAFHHATLMADTKQLEAVTDPGFIWMQRAGEQMTRKQLLDDIQSGRLRYSRIENNNVTVTIHGDTAIVRGVSSRQRVPAPGAAELAPFSAFYTLTFVRQGSGWKAVAMHTSWV